MLADVKVYEFCVGFRVSIDEYLFVPPIFNGVEISIERNVNLLIRHEDLRPGRWSYVTGSEHQNILWDQLSPILLMDETLVLDL